MSKLLVSLLLCAALLITGPRLSAQPSDYTSVSKTHPIPLADDYPVPWLIVKFHEGSRVRLRADALTTTPRSMRDEADLAKRDLDGTTVSRDLTSIETLLSSSPLFRSIRRSYGNFPEKELETLRAALEAKQFASLPDLDLIVEVVLVPGTTYQHARPLLEALNALSSVEIASVPLLCAPATVNLEGYQHYIGPAGINASSVRGSRGTSVRVCDVEFGWNSGHEDVPSLAYEGIAGDAVNYALVTHPRTCQDAAHGAAVLSIVGAPDDDNGITGIAPEAIVGVQAVGRGGFGTNPPPTDPNYYHYSPLSITLAANWACDYRDSTFNSPGGVVLVEFHTYAPPPSGGANILGCYPYSRYYYPAERDVNARSDIYYAVAAGAVVIEAAGNGGELVTTAAYPGPNGSPDSGAIMVAASQIHVTAPLEAPRECYSNFGSRIDLHAWGGPPLGATGDIHRASAGGNCGSYWADLVNVPANANACYTKSFQGTSGASAIVAGAAASLQGMALARPSNSPLSSRDLRALLKATGRAGVPLAPNDASGAEYIGMMPDLTAARLAMPVARFTVSCAGLSCTFNAGASSNAQTFSWNFGDGTSAPASSSPTIAHSFASYQGYRVSLSVKGLADVGDTINKYVTTSQAQSTSALRYFARQGGCRVFDSRPSPLQVGIQRDIPVVGIGGCGVPTTAAALVLNVTVTNPTGAGTVTVWPQGTARPPTSVVSYGAGQTVGTGTVVKLGATGVVSVVANSYSTDAIVDVTGYFSNDSGPQAGYVGPLGYSTVTPCRVADTRGNGFTGAYGPPAIAASTARDLTLTGVCGIPSGARAASQNLTVVYAQGPGFIVQYPTGAVPGNDSTLNYLPGDVRGNGLFASMNVAGVATYVAGVSGTDVVVDTSGYFSATGSQRFSPLQPCRVMDTAVAGPSLQANSLRLLQLQQQCGVPLGAKAVVLSLTLENPEGASGDVIMYPSDMGTPLVSTVHFEPGPTRSEWAVVPVASSLDDVGIWTYTTGPRVHMKADVMGYFQ